MDYITPQGISKPWSMLLSQYEASNFLILYQVILETWQAAKWTCSRDGSINICPPSQTNRRSLDIRLNEELIRTAFFTWQSLSMPTGHRKWKCLVTDIRPAEEVALTALPGHSDAQRYYKVTRQGKEVQLIHKVWSRPAGVFILFEEFHAMFSHWFILLHVTSQCHCRTRMSALLSALVLLCFWQRLSVNNGLFRTTWWCQTKMADSSIVLLDR